jgi:predicted membrane protein
MIARAPSTPAASRIHAPSLTVAVAIMLASTLYPPIVTDLGGDVDHGLATALFVAMSTGFVRGVGFIPHAPVWRWLFSGWTCLATLVLAGALRFSL